MSPEEKEQIKQEIQKKIEETKQVIENLKEQSKPVEPDRAIGRITRMDAIQQKNMAEANLYAAEETLFKLGETLEKIDLPHFGLCMKCQGPIGVPRILAIPETKLCIQCVPS